MEGKERNFAKTKQVHPRNKASLLSHLFFCWELPIFIKGYRRQLTENDLYGPLKDHQSKILGDKLEVAWNNEIETHKNPSLWRTLRKVFGLEFIIYGIILVPIELVFRLSQPLLIGKLMKFYIPDQDEISKNSAYVYASLIAVMSFFYILVGHSYALGVQHLGMKIRVACSSLIYRKSLRLSQKTLMKATTGQMVNFLSMDVNKLDFAVRHAHFLWMGPLEALIILVFLYIMLGPTAVVGIVLLLTFIPIQMYLAKRISSCRMTIASSTDQRIRLMGEIIAGIKVIKMYTWEKMFVTLVEKARKLEMQKIQASTYFRAISMTCITFLGRTAIYFCILTHVVTGHTLTPEYVYVLSSFYEIIRLGSVVFLPLAMIFLGETITSVKRLQTFLTSPEIEHDNKSIHHDSIIMEKISANWNNSSCDNILNDVSLRVKPKQLVAIIGPVGSGKSTLLQVLLKELAPLEGTFQIGDKIAYASQEPWLFGGSIRENILFGDKLDKAKYEEVLQICALEHDLSLFPHGDRTLVGERGVMLSGGQKARISLARAVYKDADFYLLDDPLSAVDAYVGKELFENCIKNFLKEKTRVLVMHQLQYLKEVDTIYLIENGRITASGTYQELQNLDNEFLKLLEDENRAELKEHERKVVVEDKSIEMEPPEEVESQGSGAISSSVYSSYFRAGGNFIIICIMLLLHIMVQSTSNGTDYFLSYWVNLEQDGINKDSLTSDDCLYIYTALIAFLIFVTLFCMFQFFKFCIRVSTRLHNKMTAKIIHMSMTFFNTNPSGRILNRFSRDIGLIDEYLPLSLVDTIAIALNIIAIAAIISKINPWILIPTVIMFVIFYFYRKVYLATSRDLKRLEGKNRSPIFSHLNTSLQGLATIRASNAQEGLKVQFDNHQDFHSSAYYLYLACDGTFGFWLDLFCVIYVGLVTLSFLFIGTESYGANVGLSITQSITMTGLLQYGMKQWSELENQMTSVERVVEYTQLEPETNKHSLSLPPSWPNDGRIKFNSVSLRYHYEDPPVLKEISFDIFPKEKIGIVGRTGAGKSSLVSVLFRLVSSEGDIFIDGLNTKCIALENLRKKISIIPQDPVLFSGTVRENLDPFEEYQDDQLWNVLEKVELKDFIAELPLGLSAKVMERGTNFSMGQRQLLCLARALIRMNKILILDEATANVDPYTDELIQAAIWKNFQECTVLTIAHRLNTVMNCDRIFVMDAGKLVESGRPSQLVERKGIFYQLLQRSGMEMTEIPRKITKKYQ